MDNRERNSFLDVTRIIAVMSVVMIHTSAGFVTSYDVYSKEFMWGNVFDSVSRIGVPLFIMVSGSLMLDENRNISLRSLLFKNIKNIVCLLFFWSALYCVISNIVFPLIECQTIDFNMLFYAWLLGEGAYHIWYLYMIVGLYLITPFLREFVKEENRHLVLLFMAISLMTRFTLPILNALSSIWEGADYWIKFIQKFYLGFFGEYITYYLIGWYLVHIGVKKKWRFYCLGLVSLLVTILYVQNTKDYLIGYADNSIFVLLYSVSVFIVLNCEPGWRINDKMKEILEALSKLSFGVYIVHPIFLNVVPRVFIYKENPFIYILLCFWTVALLSFVSCFVISKIPIIKKAIKM